MIVNRSTYSSFILSLFLSWNVLEVSNFNCHIRKKYFILMLEITWLLRWIVPYTFAPAKAHFSVLPRQISSLFISFKNRAHFFWQSNGHHFFYFFSPITPYFKGLYFLFHPFWKYNLLTFYVNEDKNKNWDWVSQKLRIAGDIYLVDFDFIARLKIEHPVIIFTNSASYSAITP